MLASKTTSMGSENRNDVRPRALSGCHETFQGITCSNVLEVCIESMPCSICLKRQCDFELHTCSRVRYLGPAMLQFIDRMATQL